MSAHVLFVDDEDGIRDVVTRQLVAEGFETVSAANGIEALAHMKKQQFDIVLLDYHMPAMSGVEVLQEMKRLGIKTPVVMLTKETDLDKAIDTLKLGVADYLTKPYFAKHLVACINRVLAKGTPHRQ